MPPPKKKGAKKTGPKKPAEPSVWEPDDGQKLRDASDRALEFIGKTIFADGYAESNKDVANVFKAPWAFAYAGDAARASKAYALLEPFVPPKRNTLLPYPSENPAYKFAYPHYPCLWALQAAEALGKPTCALRNRVEDFHAVSGAGTTEDGDCDLFSTAMRLHVATTAKKKCANATADALTAAVVKNHGLDSFYLRWQGHEVITKPPPGSELPDLFYVVNKDAGDGLYFMLAFPALVLLEHGGSLRNKSAATTLLEFLESCGGIRTSPWAHKAAAAFAAAGRHATARAIALNFLASQKADGSFGEGAMGEGDLDQTAEMALWLRVLAKYADGTAGPKPAALGPRPPKLEPVKEAPPDVRDEETRESCVYHPACDEEETVAAVDEPAPPKKKKSILKRLTPTMALFRKKDSA